MIRVSMRLGFPILLAICAALQPTAAAGAEEREGARFVIDTARSEVRFVLKATMHDVVGRSRSLAGSVDISEDGLSGARKGSARLMAASLDTGNNRRDRAMRDLIEAEKHPEIRFRAERFSEDWDRSVEEGVWRGVMHGTLTVRGVMRPVVFQIAAWLEYDELHAEGWSEFKLTYFGIEPPRFLRFFRVKDQVRLEFDIIATPRRESPSAGRFTAPRAGP